MQDDQHTCQAKRHRSALHRSWPSWSRSIFFRNLLSTTASAAESPGHHIFIPSCIFFCLMLSYHIFDILIRTSLLYTPAGRKEHDAPYPEMKVFARCDDPRGLRGISDSSCITSSNLQM